MIQKLIVIIAAAYFIVEYGLQTSKLIQQKTNRELIGYVKYFLYYFIVALILSINWLSWQLILAIIIQISFFGIIDYTKINLKFKNASYRFEIGILDIFLHLLVIWVTIIILKPGTINVDFPFNLNILISNNTSIKLYIYVSSIIFLLNGSTDLVRAVLTKVKIKDEKMEKDNTGKLIGNIERVLLFLFILFDSLAAIGFVIAAKSIARFEELKDKKFAEYYLIGTLTSTLIAIFTGKFVIYLMMILNL